MKQKIYHIFYSFIVVAVLSSCNDGKDFIGPEVKFPDGDFAFVQPLTAGYANVDFTSDIQYFKATFNQEVTWKLTVEGNISGATKVFSGVGTSIDSLATLWDGGIDNPLRLFYIETCTATLEILGLSDLYTVNFDILATKDYGPLVMDFNDVSFTNTWFYKSPQAGDVLVAGPDNSVLPPYGTYSYYATGEDVNSNFFIGNVGRNLEPAVFPTGTSDPDSLWFNIYVYGNGANNVSKLEVQFNEDDDLNNVPGYSTEDAYLVEVPLSHNGWKLYSYRYSDLTAPYSTGNDIHQPDEIMNVSFLISSVPAGNEVEVRFDYPVFTYGAPLQ